MKALVVYDTVQGNTAKAAQAIAAGIGEKTQAVKYSSVDMNALKGVDILVIGSPTNGGRATPGMQGFVDRIPKEMAQKLAVAAFDTRLSWGFLKLFKYAGVRISAALRERGCKILSEPEGFTVKGANGPLADGELERAKSWGRKLREISCP
jgi:flavodoxin